MTPERWHQINALLDAVSRIPPEKQQRYLDQQGVDDPELRRAVFSMIAHQQQAGSFLEKPATDYAAPLIEKAFDDARDPLIGREIDGYRILDVLGRGGMGIVYKALDLNLDKVVALKMIDQALARDEVFIRKFRDEAKALGQVPHSNIVLIYALRQTSLGLYIAMEYVEGETLADCLNTRGAIPWKTALPLMKQTLGALAFAHHRGVIHRDIKPRNIMCTAHGTVKVMDFGLAKITKNRGDTTVTLALAGTPRYMSPEQLCGVEGTPEKQGTAVDHRSDIFSLGMAFYEILCGRLPYKEGADQLAILKALIDESFPSPHHLNPRVPQALARIIMRALEKKVEKRYQSADEMLEALEAFERQSTKEPTSAPERDRGSRSPRGTRAVYTLLAIVLLLVGLGGYRVAAQQQIRVAHASAHPRTGELQIGARPWGRLSVDGELRIEQLEFVQSLELPAGSHIVTVEHPRYGRWERAVTVIADSTRTFVVDFADR